MIMKKALYLAIALVLATACYKDYVTDYGTSAVFAAYQYDLRSFVLGEDASFEFQVALGGVMQNTQDRKVTLSLDDGLLAGAVAGMKNKSLSSGDYVGNAITEAGITAFKPLPATFRTIEGMDDLVIKKGSHTAAVKISATSAIAADPDAFKPAYAIGFRIDSADADTVLANKNYAVIAVRCENRFYGFWSRSGVTRTYDWTGTKTGETREVASLVDSRQYEFTTVNASSVKCNKVGGFSGQMTLSFDGNNISVSSTDGKVSGSGTFNGETLLQNRQIYLRYRVNKDDGGYDDVRDTLSFRNRIRDGVNEWQDENPAHYSKVL